MDKIKKELQEVLFDYEDNLTRWINGQMCTFIHPETKCRVNLDIGKDTETLYQFLLFCSDIHEFGKINEKREAYLALLLARKGV